MIEYVCNDFERNKIQVFALVTDNAFNMTLAVKKLSEDLADESEDDDSDTEQESNSTFYESINLAFSDSLLFIAMSHMRCAAHTLQLAICDGLKIDTFASLIIKILRVVTAARTPKIDAISKK